jgi:hypothetical protein
MASASLFLEWDLIWQAPRNLASQVQNPPPPFPGEGLGRVFSVLG